MRWWLQFVLAGLGIIVLVVLVTSTALAQYSSTNYQTNEVFFGSGGQQCNPGVSGYSTNYCASSSVGDLGAGNSVSTNYQVQAGFNTTEQPFLELVVTGSNINLGYLSASSATTATGTFSIRAWNSGGYVLRDVSDPPTKNGPNPHSLNYFTTPTASSPGTEQFGENLVKNTNFCGVGCDLGADPVQVPDNTFSFGQAQSPGYSQSNLFKYDIHKAIAFSNQSTSITNFTISYLFNISSSTPAGTYTFTDILVATATY